MDGGARSLLRSRYGNQTPACISASPLSRVTPESVHPGMQIPNAAAALVRMFPGSSVFHTLNFITWMRCHPSPSEWAFSVATSRPQVAPHHPQKCMRGCMSCMTTLTFNLPLSAWPYPLPQRVKVAPAN
jgi:hypothetical protein